MHKEMQCALHRAAMVVHFAGLYRFFCVGICIYMWMCMIKMYNPYLTNAHMRTIVKTFFISFQQRL